MDKSNTYKFLATNRGKMKCSKTILMFNISFNPWRSKIQCHTHKMIWNPLRRIVKLHTETHKKQESETDLDQTFLKTQSDQQTHQEIRSDNQKENLQRELLLLTKINSCHQLSINQWFKISCNQNISQDWTQLRFLSWSQNQDQILDWEPKMFNRCKMLSTEIMKTNLELSMKRLKKTLEEFNKNIKMWF